MSTTATLTPSLQNVNQVRIRLFEAYSLTAFIRLHAVLGASCQTTTNPDELTNRVADPKWLKDVLFVCVQTIGRRRRFDYHQLLESDGYPAAFESCFVGDL
jgi:hypothetical protein